MVRKLRKRRKKVDEWVVVKVQRSFPTIQGLPRLVIYNEDRSIKYEELASSEMLEFLGDRSLAYFRVKVLRNSRGPGRHTLDFLAGKEVEARGW